MAFVALLVYIGFYTTVYLRYKLLIWLGYRFLSGMAHHVDKTRLLKDTLVRAALTLAILYPLGWGLDWYAGHIILDKVSEWADIALWFGLVPVMILTFMAYRVIKREFCTFLGFLENDWSWSRPDLSVFHISPKNMPQKTVRRPEYGEKKSSGISTWFDINTAAWDDEEICRYSQENYDRIYK